MQVVVLNGSPKGKYSTTLQTVRYLEKKNADLNFSYLNVSQQINSLVKDFSKAQELLEAADLIIFAYPVYTFMAPSQLHRFINLLKKRNLNLKDKFVTQITTSKHFYDVTAFKYVEDNCYDLNLKYIKGLSADMDDLLSEKGQKEAVEFFKYVRYCIENNLYEQNKQVYTSAKHVKVSACANVENKKGSVVIVADLKDDDMQLASMIQRFQNKFTYNTKVININKFAFAGGCISCFNCASSGKCIYKDGFENLLRDEIQTNDAIVLAFNIEDHSMGYLFKMYDDRQFCNGHRTVTMGKSFGYLVSGNLSEEENLRMVINARAEAGHNFLAGVATDEFNPDQEIDDLANKLAYAIENNYVQPANFYGVGGMKIFRDLIWLMQGFMKADHKFYAKNNQYDFPQKKWGTMVGMYFVGGLMTNEKIKKKIGNKMNEGMISSYLKVVDKA